MSILLSFDSSLFLRQTQWDVYSKVNWKIVRVSSWYLYYLGVSNHDPFLQYEIQVFYEKRQGSLE